MTTTPVAGVNRYLEVDPSSDAELFDMLRAMFGIGDWMDSDERPYHRFRMVEISKLKALRGKRRIRVEQMVVAARYCFRRRIPIKAPYQLVSYMGEAMYQRSLEQRAELGTRMSQAANDARRLGQEQWAQRLLLAQGAARQGVLDEWVAR